MPNADKETFPFFLMKSDPPAMPSWLGLLKNSSGFDTRSLLDCLCPSCDGGESSSVLPAVKLLWCRGHHSPTPPTTTTPHPTPNLPPTPHLCSGGIEEDPCSPPPDRPVTQCIFSKRVSRFPCFRVRSSFSLNVCKEVVRGTQSSFDRLITPSVRYAESPWTKGRGEDESPESRQS